MGPVQTLAIAIPGTFNCWHGQSGYLGSSAKADWHQHAAMAIKMPQQDARAERATPASPSGLQPLAWFG
jgi:hypothetical protein